MKSILSIGLAGAILLSTVPTFAMSQMEGSMTMEGKMMADSSMKMSMEGKMMNKSVTQLASSFGYKWTKDRSKLAKLAGISNYRGSASQNSRIKQYLISLNTDAVLVGGQMMVRSQDIVDNAVRANNVKTVVAAVKAAGLVDTLKSAGPFTVFAPTDSAFAKLPAGTVETLVKPENKATLVDILTYHVVSGKYTTANLMDGMELTTVEGKKLMIKKDSSGKIWINGSAMIETANVISSNGVTHVIDTVLMPK